MRYLRIDGKECQERRLGAKVSLRLLPVGLNTPQRHPHIDKEHTLLLPKVNAHSFKSKCRVNVVESGNRSACDRVGPTDNTDGVEIAQQPDCSSASDVEK